MSFALVPALPVLRPAVMLTLLLTLNDTEPSPEAIVCCEIAPASQQPLQPPFFVIVLPLTVTLTGLAHTTFSVVIVPVVVPPVVVPPVVVPPVVPPVAVVLATVTVRVAEAVAPALSVSV